MANQQSKIEISASEIHAPEVKANDASLQAGLGTVYFIAGIVCVVMMVIAGVRYVTSSGDSGNIASAKNTILYSAIGLIIIIFAAAITQLIFSRLPS